MAKKIARAPKNFIPPIKDLLWPAVIVIALVTFYGFLFLIVGSKGFVPLINGLVWPTVVVIALVTFRKPLSDFLRGIAQRATKLSFTQFFAVELSLPEVPNLRLDRLGDLAASIGVEELRTHSAVASGTYELFKLLSDEKGLEALIIDLGTGDQWLTSRLFLFAAMLQDLRGLRCIVFVETRGHIRYRFVGTAKPNEIRRALADQYPWLEKAYIRAPTPSGDVLSQPEGTVDMQIFLNWQGNLLNQIQSFDVLDHSRIEQSINSFLDLVRINPNKVLNQKKEQPPDPSDMKEWVFLENSNFWEHAHWIKRGGLKDELRDALQNSDDAWLKDPPGISQAKRVREILCRRCSFVALVNEDRVFKSLIDREALLEQVAEHIGATSDGQ